MKDRRELVFGFVLPLGVDKDLIHDCLHTALCAAGYELDRVHVSAHLEDFATGPEADDPLKRKQRLMDAGDNMRQQWNEYVNRDRDAVEKKDHGDAVALVAVSQIRQLREDANVSTATAIPTDQEELEVFKRQMGNTPRENVAYLVDSLKHPDELQLLKRVYGPAFVSIGVYSPPDSRKAFLLKQQGGSKKDAAAVAFVERLMKRDETGEDQLGRKIKLGQDVSDAFFVTDFIVDSTKEKHDIVGQFTRLIELLFGDIYKTPSLDEMGMFLARGVQVRSGSLARQIGASILRKDGSIVSAGTNEVARPISGGQYWYVDDHQYAGRDMVYLATDTSDRFRAEMIEDLLERLDGAGALAPKFSVTGTDGTSPKLEDNKGRWRLEQLYFADDAPLQKSRIRDNIDYVRAVHAEGAAIIDAARNGVATKKCIMFTTTFPCHECARHIVAAGIREVIYLEPYPKSAVKDLYGDSIQVDPKERDKKKVLFRTFVGVSPSRYLEFFTVDRARKDIHGQRMTFELRKEQPRLPDYTPPNRVAIANEGLEFEQFTDFLESRRASVEATTIPSSTS